MPVPASEGALVSGDPRLVVASGSHLILPVHTMSSEHVSVEEFLQAIFPDPNSQPFIGKSKYETISNHISDLSPNLPAYYTICAIIGDGRKNENFKSLNVLVCDDVNTKATPPPLTPSYVIETSPNNYQWGYILQTPEENPSRAKTIIKLLSKSPYSDTGLNGMVRLVRLPFGINEKPEHQTETGKPKVKLTTWNPELKYSYDQLITLLKPDKTPKPDNYTPPDDIHDGSRNTELTQLLGHYLATTQSKAEAIAKLVVFNQLHTHPPLETRELQGIIDSISNKESEKYDEHIHNIYHVIRTNEWYDFNISIPASTNSINTSYLRQFPGTKGKPLITKWLSMQEGFNEAADYTWFPMPHGQQLRTIQDGNRLLLNTWRGFNITPEPGPIDPWLDLLHHVVPEPDYAEALLWWVAFTIQQPQLKCNWQPIILGIEDAGKDSLFQPIATILGSAFKPIGNKDIKDKFDDGIYETKLLHISEAAGLYGEALEYYKRITATESSDMQMLNIKGGKKVFQRNICNVLVITNNLNAMSLSANDRRAFVVRAPNVMTVQQKADYHEGWRKCGGPNFLFDYLLKYDLSKFSPNTRPFRTTYFEDMFAMTRSDEEIALEDLLADYEVARPKLLATVLPTGNKYSINEITLWLENNGWVRWDADNKLDRIKGNIDGKQVVKDRTWYVKKKGSFYKSQPSVMCREVHRVETILNKLSENITKKY